MKENHTIYRLHSGYVLRPFLEECLIIPVGLSREAMPNMGILSPVGQFLWMLLEEGKTFEQLLDAVLGEFEVEPQTAARDIEEFLEQLDHNHYLMKTEDNDEKEDY